MRYIYLSHSPEADTVCNSRNTHPQNRLDTTPGAGTRDLPSP